MFSVSQVYGSVCPGICLVLLLQEVSHVWHSADSGILWLHIAGLLRVLPHAWHRLILLVFVFCSLHLSQLKDGLTVHLSLLLLLLLLLMQPSSDVPYNHTYTHC